MRNVLERLSPGARIAVVRLRSLGDCVLTTPAISLLKKARPDLRIAVIVEDAFAPVYSGNPDIEAILGPSAVAIARWNPELTLNLHGGSTSARLTVASRARLRAGFAHYRFQPLYNIRIPRAQEILGVERKVHTAEHVASSVFYLGVHHGEIPRASLWTSLPYGRGFRRADGQSPAERHSATQGTYAVLHPMASQADKTWPAANFLQIAEQLNVDPVFIAGPGENLEPFSRFRCLSGASLEDIKSLLADATLFIGNDSGPAHMAAAFGVPVIALFGSSDSDVWYPWKTDSRVLKHPQGIRAITVPEVLEAAERLVPLPR